MSDAIPGTRKKRGRPKVGSTQVQVRVEPELLAAVDKLAEAIEGTRPEALRFALTQYMEADGFLKSRPRLPQHLLVELGRPEADALSEAVGPDVSDQQEAIRRIVRDWLKSHGYLRDG